MLQGSFETFEFAEVLIMLSRKRQTGRLRLHAGSSSVELQLVDGRLRQADVVDHGGAVKVADSRASLEEACFRVMRWDHGGFEFHPGPAPTSERGGDVSVDSVLGGAKQRLEEWDYVERVIPNMEVQPRMSTHLVAPETTVDRETWRVLAAIDGRRNIQALSRHLGVSAFDLCRRLAHMVSAGMVELGNNRPKVALPNKGTLKVATRGTLGSSRPAAEEEGEEEAAGSPAPATADAAAEEGQAEDGPEGQDGGDAGPGASEESAGEEQAAPPGRPVLRIASRFRIAPSGG